MLRLIIDFIPLIIFFVAMKLQGIFFATIALMVAMSLQCVIIWWLKKKVEKMLLYSTLLVLVAGGLTVVFQEPKLIQWKPTLFTLSIALILWVSLVFAKKNVMKAMLSTKFSFSDGIWHSLCYHWIIFFVAIGLVNLLVVYYTSFDTWVTFKVFGITAINIIFIVFEGFWLYTKGALTSKDLNEHS